MKAMKEFFLRQDARYLNNYLPPEQNINLSLELEDLEKAVEEAWGLDIYGYESGKTIYPLRGVDTQGLGDPVWQNEPYTWVYDHYTDKWFRYKPIELMGY